VLADTTKIDPATLSRADRKLVRQVRAALGLLV
jgi:hypothetical protein